MRFHVIMYCILSNMRDDNQLFLGAFAFTLIRGPIARVCFFIVFTIIVLLTVFVGHDHRVQVGDLC